MPLWRGTTSSSPDGTRASVFRRTLERGLKDQRLDPPHRAPDRVIGIGQRHLAAFDAENRAR